MRGPTPCPGAQLPRKRVAQGETLPDQAALFGPFWLVHVNSFGQIHQVIGHDVRGRKIFTLQAPTLFLRLIDAHAFGMRTFSTGTLTARQ